MAIENFDNTSVDVQTLKPFKKFIMSIGELPTNYIDSLSYAELLTWFCDYLQNKVIPVVDNNAEAIIELQNYINNLDLQDEVNNKLDEMASDGTLEEIMASYLDTKAIFCFDNVADLKLATNLIDGSYAKTLGYNTKNDQGGATYYIRTTINTDVIDEANIIALHDDTLVAVLVLENAMNIKCWGAKGDGTTDDTSAIQKAFDSYNDLYISDGTYMVNAITSLFIKNNTTLNMSKNAILKAITNNATNYAIIKINNVNNIIINGGIVEGDRTTHTGETGEWGMGISITQNSENITIKNITLKDCWGDGLYIKSGKNIVTENIICDNNRRQGLSIISVDSYHSINDKFINTNGTNPQSGVDIEPNESTEILKNIIFDNPYTYNNSGAGIDLHLGSPNDELDITINNHYDKNSNTGVTIQKGNLSKGRIIINDSYYINNKCEGFRLRNCYNSDCRVIINKPYIINCNTEDLSSTYLACISIYTTSGTEANYALGNVEINEPYLSRFNTSDSKYGIYIGDQAHSNPAQNITLRNILYLQSNLRVGGTYSINNFNLKDENEILKLDRNYAYNIGFNDIVSLFTNTNFATGRTETLTDSFPIGQEITFIRTNNTYYLDVKLDSGLYCYLFADTAEPRIRLNKGSSITLKRISDTEFIVTNVVGTYSVV